MAEVIVSSVGDLASTLDVGAVIAAHIAGTEFEQLPPAAVEAAKQSILDTIGVMFAAGSSPGIDAVAQIVREQGGVEEATVLGYGYRVPAAMAAFANGAMGHCMDFDDYHETGLHPSTPTVPSALAMAERVGATGRQLLTAVALANDFAGRLGASTQEARADVPGRAWYTSPLFGYFTAAAAAGKVLRLDAERLFNALGIAFCQVGGTVEMIYSPGSYIGGLNAGWPNKAGVLSALMAERGVPGVPTAFDGRLGFFSMFFGSEHDPELLTDGLGERFRGEEVSFKPWPVCGGTYNAIEAAMDIVNEHDISPDEVRDITVTVRTLPAWNLCEPLDVRRRPSTVRDSKFSLPYTIAVAVAKRRVTLGDFTLENLEDERVLGLAQKVRPIFDDTYHSPNDIISPLTVTIEAGGKGTHTRTVERSRGRWPDGMTRSELVDKFKDCVSHSVQPLPASQIDTAADMICRLEELDDVRRLAAQLR
jgi:2-methylcitrate dehydratase PrpD